MADIKNLDIDGIMFDCVITSGKNSNGWYRIWRSGLIEQGGTRYVNATSDTIPLPIAYSDKNYTINYSEHVYNGTESDSDTEGVDYNFGVSNKTTTTLYFSGNLST